MSRVVDIPIKLPRQWASSGAEIKNSAVVDDHGLRTVARAQNTLYDQHRGQLVNDADWSSEATLLAVTGGPNLRWVVPLWGGGSLTETVTVGVWARGNGGLGGAVIRFSDGTNTADVAANTGSAATIFKSTATMTIVDNAENATITATHWSGTIGVVHSAFVYYNRTRSTLPASLLQYYPGTTFCAFDTTTLFDEGFPVTSAMGYTFRDNAAELYSRVGPAITSSWGNSPLAAGKRVGFVKKVPENVTTLRVFVDGVNLGASATFLVTTNSGTAIGNFPVSRGFTGVDLDVTGLDVVTVTVFVGTNGSLYGVSGYWMARSLPA